LYITSRCAACHSTETWSIARRFYTPSQTTNDIFDGTLQTTDYTAASTFPNAANPPTDNGSRTATLRFLDPANDQLSCAIRAVGTFPASIDFDSAGIAPSGVRVKEVRADMNTVAQGAAGYSPPSLLGVHAGGPFFHAGNARTLEELFSATFVGHHAVYGGPFTGGDSLVTIQLITYLLSIDEGSTYPPITPQGQLGFNPMLCPESF
jgi:hypothetical protein